MILFFPVKFKKAFSNLQSAVVGQKAAAVADEVEPEMAGFDLSLADYDRSEKMKIIKTTTLTFKTSTIVWS